MSGGLRPLGLASVLLGLAACSTSQAPLTYAPSQATSHGPVAPAVVASVTAVDQRGETANSSWIGAIRGGFGNPLKRLEADRPVADVVRG